MISAIPFVGCWDCGYSSEVCAVPYAVLANPGTVVCCPHCGSLSTAVYFVPAGFTLKQVFAYVEQSGMPAAGFNWNFPFPE